MPKQKAPKGAAAAEASDVSDPRFSNFSTDPRFRLPSKKHTRTKIDKRFSRMLKDDDFSNSATVDRYGRKLSTSGKKKALERLYVPDEEEEEEEEEEVDEADVEVEDDEVVEKELKRAEAYDPARGGGFSSSEDEDEEDEEEGGVEIVEEEFPDLQAESAAVEMGEVSSRIAVVNMDWDNIRSADLMAVFSSFVRPGGKILKISIYPSEFGKERMEREELEGPPKEIFARKEEEYSEVDSEDDSEDEEEKIKKDLLQGDEGKEFDSAALRQYQLDRLRYYYAVVICSDNETAQNVYENTDGSEYLSSANVFDLRFIPDGVEFDDKPRDECEGVPTGYKPIEFVTDALQHSKSKLTWDTTPEEASRKDAISQAFSGSRKDHLDNDLRAYLGSDSEEESEEEADADDGPKLSKKELARQKMRAALGLSDEPATSKKIKGPVGDMEVTFTAGLSSKDSTGVFENEPSIDETTAERYVRLEKERKARRKEKAKAKREGRDPDAEPEPEAENADMGFDDPFFATDEAVKEKASKSVRKEERLKKREAKAAAAAASANQRAELELLMQENATEEGAGANLDHFDIKEIARAEKLKKKGKKHKKAQEVEGGKRGGLQQGFEMDVGDERFSKLFQSHEFAIDPTNPKFVATDGMKKLLEEGRRKRDRDVGEGDEVVVKKSKKSKRVEADEGKGELSGLVEKISKKVRQ
ncbi:hypothetical protein IFR05_001957 [Cadophora sp. M221]|nr:hypothetical protein IFR05_001957 [Cadophora sp. M221]